MGTGKMGHVDAHDRRAPEAMVAKPEAEQTANDERRSRPTIESHALGALTVYLALLFFIPAQYVLPGFGAAGRPSSIFGLGLFALWAVMKILPDVTRRRSPIRRYLFMYASAVLVSYSLAFDRGLLEVEALAADRSLIALVSFAGAVLVAAEGLPSLRDIFSLARRLVLMTAIVALSAVVQFTTAFDVFARMRYPGLVLNSDINSLTNRGAGALVRVKGSTLHPIEFGVMMGMVLPIVVHVALHEEDVVKRRWWFAAAALHATAAFMSVSRSAALALAVIAVVLAWSWSPLMRIRAAAASLILLVLMRGAIPGLLGTVLSLFRNLDNDPSISGRTDDFAVVGGFIFDRPYFGRGPDTFIPSLYIVLDNAYLLGVISIGFIGMATLLLLIFAALGQGRHCYRQSSSNAARHLAIAISASVMVSLATSATFDYYSFPTVTTLLFVFIGMLSALALPEPHGRQTIHYAPPDLLRPSYRAGFPRNPWWHRFDPYLRRVQRRDNRIAEVGGTVALRSSCLRVKHYPGSVSSTWSPQWGRMLSSLLSQNIELGPLSVSGLVIRPPDVIHVTEPERWLSGDLLTRIRGWVILSAIALARRRRSVLVVSFEEGDTTKPLDYGKAVALFERMVDAATYRSAAHAKVEHERRPGLVGARSHIVRYGHLKGASSVAEISYGEARKQLDFDDRAVVVIAGLVGEDEVAVLDSLFTVQEHSNLNIVFATDDAIDLTSNLRGGPELEAMRRKDRNLILCAADLVVVPWATGANRRSVMTALSMGKRVLTPTSPDLAELQASVTRDWLRFYEGRLSSLDITQALSAEPEIPVPDLEAFGWNGIADVIRAIYEGAIASPTAEGDPLLLLDDSRGVSSQ